MEDVRMSGRLRWSDRALLDLLRQLDQLPMAQEFLRRIPAYASGYRLLTAQLDRLHPRQPDERQARLADFAKPWGLSFPC